MLVGAEMERLKAACLKLQETNVQTDETSVARDPILILMSTVLSLERRWYLQALPARNHFQSKIYSSAIWKTLTGFRDFIFDIRSRENDWEAVSRVLWGNREKTKARILYDLVVYFADWHEKNMPMALEIDAMRDWPHFVDKKKFVKLIDGLGPRAYEQLLWYIEGKQSVKFDRHVEDFVTQAVGRKIADEEAIQALRQIANEMGISATALDARIWDYMQSRSGGRKGKRRACYQH